MRIYEVLWLEPIVEKLWQKHHVEIEEVEEVLTGRPGSATSRRVTSPMKTCSWLGPYRWGAISFRVLHS